MRPAQRRSPPLQGCPSCTADAGTHVPSQVSAGVGRIAVVARRAVAGLSQRGKLRADVGDRVAVGIERANLGLHAGASHRNGRRADRRDGAGRRQRAQEIAGQTAPKSASTWQGWPTDVTSAHVPHASTYRSQQLPLAHCQSLLQEPPLVTALPGGGRREPRRPSAGSRCSSGRRFRHRTAGAARRSLPCAAPRKRRCRRAGSTTRSPPGW